MVKVPKEARVLADRAVRLLELPRAYLRLRQAMGKQNSSLADMAAVVARDPALTAQVLRVINSPLYGASREVATVQQAVGLLGMDRVHDVALAASVSTAFNDLDDGELNLGLSWQRSMFCALAGREIARERGADADRVFVAGLLADIGHLVMYAVPVPSVRKALDGVAPWRPDTCALESEALGFHHAHVGAALLDAWSLPDELVDWVLRQEHPADGGPLPDELCATHVASRLADGWMCAADIEDVWERLEPDAVADLHATQDGLSAVRERAAEQVADSLRIVMPRYAQVA